VHAQAYDELRIGDRSYFLSAGLLAGRGRGGSRQVGNHAWPGPACAGEENFVKAFTKHFPDQEDAIRRWAKLCKQVSDKGVFFNLKIAKPAWLARLINRWTGAGALSGALLQLHDPPCGVAGTVRQGRRSSNT
jgi:all-trans-retinol 13,14-reductase